MQLFVLAYVHVGQSIDIVAGDSLVIVVVVLLLLLLLLVLAIVMIVQACMGHTSRGFVSAADR
jgi:hypothetical protein